MTKHSARSARSEAVETTLALAEGAYSENRYRSWPAVAKALLGRGYTEHEAAAIMLSKWVRWAADGHGGRYGSVPAKAILNYIDDPRNQATKEAVAELVEGTRFSA